MDRVRFGRALGMGTRDAARALLKAADAATAPSPAGRTTPGKPVRADDLGRRAAQHAVDTTHKARATSAGVKRGGKRFGEAVWRPFVKVSGVLWLEVTGVFFGLFALFAGLYAWKHRGDLHAAGGERPHLLLALAMLVLFGYFTVSSFWNAHRRGKQR